MLRGRLVVDAGPDVGRKEGGKNAKNNDADIGVLEIAHASNQSETNREQAVLNHGSEARP
jgi:hypothetical protein